MAVILVLASGRNDCLNYLRVRPFFRNGFEIRRHVLVASKYLRSTENDETEKNEPRKITYCSPVLRSNDLTKWPSSVSTQARMPSAYAIGFQFQDLSWKRSHWYLA